MASEAFFVNHLYDAPSRGHMQAGFRTRHITTVDITTASRDATCSANLHAITMVLVMNIVGGDGDD